MCVPIQRIDYFLWLFTVFLLAELNLSSILLVDAENRIPQETRTKAMTALNDTYAPRPSVMPEARRIARNALRARGLWVAVAAFVLIFIYEGKYQVDEWYRQGIFHLALGDQALSLEFKGYPLLSWYFELAAWFIGAAIAFGLIGLLIFFWSGWKTFWYRIRNHALTVGLGALLLFPIAVPGMIALDTVYSKNQILFPHRPANEETYGLLAGMPWWMIAELAITGETCDVHQPLWKDNAKVYCYTSFNDSKARPIRNADARDLPWYSFF